MSKAARSPIGNRDVWDIFPFLPLDSGLPKNCLRFCKSGTGQLVPYFCKAMLDQVCWVCPSHREQEHNQLVNFISSCLLHSESPVHTFKQADSPLLSQRVCSQQAQIYGYYVHTVCCSAWMTGATLAASEYFRFQTHSNEQGLKSMTSPCK